MLPAERPFGPGCVLMSKDRPHLCGCPGNWSKLREYGGWGAGRAHLLDVQFADLVLHHHGDRLRTQDSDAMQRAAVQQRLQERHVVPRRAEGAATAHEELRPLRHLEGRRIQPAIGAAVVESGYTPPLLGPPQTPRTPRAATT